MDSFILQNLLSPVDQVNVLIIYLKTTNNEKSIDQDDKKRRSRSSLITGLSKLK